MKYPRSNSDTALALIEQFRGLIDGIAYRMGQRYHLSTEDREDLKAAAIAKLSTIPWHKRWARIKRTWKPEINGKKMPPPSLNNYAISTIQSFMAKELRRIKAFGLSGLSKGPAISEFPWEEDRSHFWPDNPGPKYMGHDMKERWEDTIADDYDSDEPGADGLPDRLAAHQIALLASQVLTWEEQNVVALRFAFDGGPDRTEMQIAKELDISRAKVAILMESAMTKLRRAVGR